MRNLAWLMLLLATVLAGCYGSTVDAMYPGSLGHDPPPAVFLPPQDAGMEHM
jgi:hypothetical protein